MVAPPNKTKSPSGKLIRNPRKWLKLVASVAEGPQEEALKKGTDAASVPNRLATLAVPPAAFEMTEEKQYQ